MKSGLTLCFEAMRRLYGAVYFAIPESDPRGHRGYLSFRVLWLSSALASQSLGGNEEKVVWWCLALYLLTVLSSAASHVYTTGVMALT